MRFPDPPDSETRVVFSGNTLMTMPHGSSKGSLMVGLEVGRMPGRKSFEFPGVYSMTFI